MRWNPGAILWSVTVPAVVFICTLAAPAEADVPRMLNYQGRATDADGIPLDTTVGMRFYIYTDSTAGSVLWWENHTSVNVTGGLFEVILGSITPIGSGVFNGSDRWLGMAIGADPPSALRTRIVSAPYAYHARHADTAEYAFNATGGSGGWLDTGTRVRLISSGDSVGIGTSAPTEKLHVNGHIQLSEYFDLKFGSSGCWFDASGTDLSINTGDDLHLQPTDNIYIRQGTDPTFMTIDPGSKSVGIGVTAPEDMVHIVNGASGGSAFLRVEANHATNWHEAGIRVETPQNRWHLRMDDDSNNQIPDGALGLRSQDAAREVMTWAENGNIGINATNPDRRLHVNGNTLIDGNLRVYDTLHASVVQGSIEGPVRENSITADQILNETGLAHRGFWDYTSVGTAWQVLSAESTYVPRGGHILVLASFNLTAEHSASGYTLCRFGIADNDDSVRHHREFEYLLPSWADAGSYSIPVTIQRLYTIYSGGTYKYYLLGEKDEDNTVWCDRRDLTLIYIPTSYEVTSEPPPTASIENLTEDGATTAENRISNGNTDRTSLANILEEMKALRKRIELLEGR